jgi:tripeptidyl-peptidase-1
VFWSIYANSTAEIDDILQWALQMSNTDNRTSHLLSCLDLVRHPVTDPRMRPTTAPQVNSLSYGMSEVNVDKYLGRGYLARADFEFKKLALRGITIIIASGDTGAGDLGDEPMTVPNCDTLHADWPSQSVYVTSVGSTIITPAAEPICYREAGAIDCLGNPLGEIVVSVDQVHTHAHIQCGLRPHRL